MRTEHCDAHHRSFLCFSLLSLFAKIQYNINQLKYPDIKHDRENDGRDAGANWHRLRRRPLSQKLFESLLEQQLQLSTKLRKTLRNTLLPLSDKLLLRKRALIETINDPLKNMSPIEPTRHRSVINSMVNLLAGLVAYTY